ncbi:HD domain-containing protein [Candidatus Poribacteria bacterium]|nr:HD domain-containing protein [Candidatus Poribacteria bacterium]
MPKEKLYRDPVHDLIVLDLEKPGDRLLFNLIDCREVQRLRRIRQLGMAHMAFHGAEHSRFSHSFGVMHLSRRLMERLTREAPVEERLALAVQCAALLHDVGHGPFSHVIEKFFADHHEAWTARIILDPGTEVHRVLSSFDSRLPADVVGVIRGGIQPGWLSRVISSQLDADRFDYLLRDSHMTGVKYGVFDLERLLLLLRVSDDGDKVVVSSKGLLPVEKYLQSRYQMYRQVYFHKTVTAAEAMLMSALRRAGDLAREGGCPGVPEDSPFGRVLAGKDNLAVADYLELDDSVILGALNAWSRCGDAVLADLSSRLLNRRLFKSLEIANYEEHDLEVKMRIEHAEEVLSGVELDPRYYLLYSKSADTPYRPYDPRSAKPGATIWIEDRADPRRLVDIKEVSPTIRAFTESPYTIWRAFFPAEAGGKSLRETIGKAFNG